MSNRIKKFSVSVSILILLISSLHAVSVCTVTDAFGRVVSLNNSPRRIVLAGKAVVMTADALYLFPGAAERVAAIGITDQGLGNFMTVLDLEASRKQDLGKTAGVEEIASRNPDLVILKTSMKGSLGSALEAAGIPVVYLSLETPDEYKRDLRIIGTLLGNSSRAEELITLYTDRITELRQKTSGLSKKNVLVLSATQKGGKYSFLVSPESWIQAEQVKMAGGKPVWTGAASSQGWNQIQFEQIASWNPDVIIILSYNDPSLRIVDGLKKDALWGGLKALQKNQIFAFPSDFYSWGQPDTRWILGAQWMARILYPEVFADELFESRIQGFFTDFYSLDDTAYRNRIKPVLQGSLN